MNALFKLILKAAETKGLSQQDLARAAGIHPGSLSRALHNGRCQLETVEKLAHAVGLRLTCAQDNELSEWLARGEVF